MAAADLVVSRAGASALGEYPCFGLPAILVPYPYAWRYQKVNAVFLEKQGAAVLLPDEKMAARLLPTIQELFTNTDRLKVHAGRHASVGSPERGPGNRWIGSRIGRIAKGRRIMVSIDVLFWLFIFMFGIIGLMRGWAKEMMVTFSVILALFIVTVLETYVPFVTKLTMDAQRPGGDPLTVFWLRVIILDRAELFRLPDPQHTQVVRKRPVCARQAAGCSVRAVFRRRQRLPDLGHFMVFPGPCRVSLSRDYLVKSK